MEKENNYYNLFKSILNSLRNDENNITNDDAIDEMLDLIMLRFLNDSLKNININDIDILKCDDIELDYIYYCNFNNFYRYITFYNKIYKQYGKLININEIDIDNIQDEDEKNKIKEYLDIINENANIFKLDVILLPLISP